MKTKQETFASCISSFQYHYDLRTVFDDFLTMSICAFSYNPHTGKSYDEELYLQTIAKYKEDKLRFEFPNLLAHLTLEMDERYHSDSGNDILGEYYEEHLARKGAQQFFTPWPICTFMAKSICDQHKEIDAERPLRILEPTCGSGRMLLAAAQMNGPSHEYYGVDIDKTCVKMSAINLFLNGLFHSEVLCADILMPEDFKISYRISFLPFGIFRIQQKENSVLWHLLKNSWESRVNNKPVTPPNFESSKPLPEGDQLIMF